MVQILLFTLLLSSNISAFSFTKVSGTFVPSEKKEVLVGDDTLMQAASANFDVSTARSPASAEVEESNADKTTAEVEN